MGLLELIRKNNEVRKIFGKQELKIIEKQLLGVSLTASEKIRLSRDIRKKFQVVKKLSKFSNEFDLKKSEEINFILNEAKEVILGSKHFKNIKKIFVFGSFVENKMTLDSDVDIAVEFFNISKRDATKFRAEISGRINKKIDLQVFNLLPKKIQNQILKRSRIIYEHEKSQR